MKTAAYIRVSTAAQNLDGQKACIEDWLASHGIEDAEWFVDQESGSHTNRPGLKRLKQAIFDGRVDTVVVYKIDRLSRSLRDGITLLCEWLENAVRLISVSQQFDFQGSTGKLIASVLLSVVEMEMELRRERQAEGIKAAKKRNAYRHCGRPKQSTKANPKRARELKEQGLKTSEIARVMGISRPTVYAYLKN